MGNFISLENTLTNDIEIVESKLEKKYGWKPDKLDYEDNLYQLHHEIDQEWLPEEIDLRPQCPEVYDQGKLGSCTANAISAAYQFDELKQNNKKVFSPSRLFIYYNERSMEGTIDKDAGAEIRNGMKSINTIGVCSKELWPYDEKKFTVKPDDEAYQDAKIHTSISYQRLSQNLNEMKHCLSEGLPFVFGFIVYQSFESGEIARTGYMNMPLSKDKILGGHAVMAVGYTKEHIIVRNSWGDKWGDKGYFYMPYKYILNSKLASDFWVLKRVTKN